MQSLDDEITLKWKEKIQWKTRNSVNSDETQKDKNNWKVFYSKTTTTIC